MLLRVARPLQAIRHYSAPAKKLAAVDSSKLVIKHTQIPGTPLKDHELVFGKTFTGTSAQTHGQLQDNKQCAHQHLSAILFPTIVPTLFPPSNSSCPGR